MTSSPLYYDNPLTDIGDRIFVVGTNCAGRHGKSAALTARQRYGLPYGKFIGHHGQSFGIPTKSASLEVLDLWVIESYVRDIFRPYVARNTHLYFYVTPFGTGEAGYRHEDIAPMLKDMEGIERCMVSRYWEPYL